MIILKNSCKHLDDAAITYRLSRKDLIHAAGMLMPSLIRAHRQSDSEMIAALFPIIYQEFAKAEEVPNFLKFLLFVDWDPCKTARHDLVDAFMSSSWKAGDLALTACRCNDVAKILKRVSQANGGTEYIALIENDLDRLNDKSRRLVKRTIAEIRSEKL